MDRQVQWTCLEWRSDMWYVGNKEDWVFGSFLGVHIFLQSIHTRGELLVKSQCTLCMFHNQVVSISYQTVLSTDMIFDSRFRKGCLLSPLKMGESGCTQSSWSFLIWQSSTAVLCQFHFFAIIPHQSSSVIARPQNHLCKWDQIICSEVNLKV